MSRNSLRHDNETETASLRILPLRVQSRYPDGLVPIWVSPTNNIGPFLKQLARAKFRLQVVIAYGSEATSQYATTGLSHSILLLLIRTFQTGGTVDALMDEVEARFDMLNVGNLARNRQGLADLAGVFHALPGPFSERNATIHEQLRAALRNASHASCQWDARRRALLSGVVDG
jgi:hypothetical protein